MYLNCFLARLARHIPWKNVENSGEDHTLAAHSGECKEACDNSVNQKSYMSDIG